MAKGLNRLSARAAVTLSKPGRHADGGGLYLSVSKDGRRRWVFLYRWQGRTCEMGLGAVAAVPLAHARELAARYRLELLSGRSPLHAKRESEEAQRRETAEREAARTFGVVADELIAAKAPGWRNAKHRAQWRMTLAVYAAPLRPVPVAEVDTEHILAVLQPIWMTKPETASRTRGRIEAVLDAARARGLIPAGAANPARWRGHLDHLLPKPRRLSRGHHAALPWQDMPAFMADLRGREAPAARLLEFLILTAARSGEARGATWDEIDLAARVWTVPAERMKAGVEHRVPLADAALALLAAAGEPKAGVLVFPGGRGRPFSDMVFGALFERMGRADTTAHGFRSTFRDWAGEATHHAREVCEAALAHAVGNAVEQAYRRGDALEKRRALMADWAAFVGRAPAGNVVPIRARGGAQ